MDKIKVEITKELINKDDTILIKIPISKDGYYYIPFDQIEQIYNKIQKLFPNNSIIILPNRLDFRSTDKIGLQNEILSMLNEVDVKKYKDVCNFYKGELEALFDIVEKHPVSMDDIVELVQAAIPLFDYTGGYGTALLAIYREIQKRHLTKEEIE